MKRRPRREKFDWVGWFWVIVVWTVVWVEFWFALLGGGG
jgi:hypothetical protein